MAEDGEGMGDVEEGREEVDTEEDKELPRFANLYRLIYGQPDVVLSFVLQLLDILEEKGILNEGESDEILREGIERWTERK